MLKEKVDGKRFIKLVTKGLKSGIMKEGHIIDKPHKGNTSSRLY